MAASVDGVGALMAATRLADRAQRKEEDTGAEVSRIDSPAARAPVVVAAESTSISPLLAYLRHAWVWVLVNPHLDAQARNALCLVSPRPLCVR